MRLRNLWSAASGTLTCSFQVLDDACKKIKLSYVFPTTGTVSTPHPSKKHLFHPSTPFPLHIGLLCLAFTMNQKGPLPHPAKPLGPNETRRTKTESFVSVVKPPTTFHSTAQDVKHTVGDAVVKDTGLTIVFGPPQQPNVGAASASKQGPMKKSTARFTKVVENVDNAVPLDSCAATAVPPFPLPLTMTLTATFTTSSTLKHSRKSWHRSGGCHNPDASVSHPALF